MPDDLADIRSHIGNRHADADVATAAPVLLFQKTLGRRDLEPEDGAAIPAGWHMLYFLPRFEQAELGPDGAPASSGVIPEMPFPRRMYAGTRLAFHEPIRIGDRLHRETELVELAVKDGSTGRLAFATVESRISTPRGLAVVEQRDTVYREETPAGAANRAPKRAAPPDDTVWEAEERPDEVTLFRFSALTFNAHRIHYDSVWAKEVEGYPALVVHGPLSQSYLMNFARDCMAPKRMTSFDMRARAPLFIDGPVRLVGRPTEDGCEVWAVTPEGTIAMSASAGFA